MKKQIIILFLLLVGYSYSQPIYTGVNRDTVVAIINEQSQGLKKIYGVIKDGSVTTWNVFGFNSDATNVISGDTLIVTDASGELDLEGIVSSNDYDFTIVGTPTVYQLKVEWGGFTGKIISFIWQTDTISTAFVEYSGTSNTYNYDFDTLSFRTFSDLKYLGNADSTNQRTFSDLKYATKVITDSLAEDIDALPTVAETKAIVSDSLNYTNSGNVIITQSTSGNPDVDNYIPVLYGTGEWANEALADLPISIATASELSDKSNLISDLTTRVNSLETQAANNETLIAALYDSIASLRNDIGSGTIYPEAPTNFVATPTSVSNVNLTWEGGFRNYSAVIIWRSTTGSNYSELLRQIGSDSTYSNTGLTEGTTYWYRVSFYDSTYQLQSNYSDSDTATTFTTPAGSTDTYIYASNGADLTGWTETSEAGNTVTVQDTGGDPYHYWLFDWGGSNDGMYIRKTIDAEDTLWISFDLYLEDGYVINANQTSEIFAIKNSTNYILGLYGRANVTSAMNQWRVTGSGVTTTSNTNGFATKQWIRMQLRWIYGNGDGSIKVYADNNTITSQTGLTMTYATADILEIGQINGAVAPPDSALFKIDNFIVAKDSGTGNIFDTDDGGTPAIESVYYVSASATAGTGTFADPYTISQANTAATAGDTIIVLNGTYNFTDRYTFSNGGSIAEPVVWLAESKGGVSFVANHNATVDAFVISGNCIVMDSIYWYGQETARRSVIQVNGDYVTLKNGESHTRSASAYASDNDNIRGEGCNNFLMQNFVVDSSCANAINIQTTAVGQVHNLVFDNVTITNINFHNGINIFPNTGISDASIIIDTVIVKNCNIYGNSAGSCSGIFFRRVKGMDIYNNIIVGEISLNVNYNYPMDTLAAEYSDRKSVIAHNTIIGNGSKQGLYNSYANGLLVKNNVWWGETSGELYLRFFKESTIPNAPISRQVFDYNLYYQDATDAEYWNWNGSSLSWTNWKATNGGQESHSINYTKGTDTDDIFVDVANRDYTPQTSSPLINAAEDLDGTYSFLALDRNGVSRATSPDIGAIEKP